MAGYDEILERQRMREESAAQDLQDRRDQFAEALESRHAAEFDALIQTRRLFEPTGLRACPTVYDVFVDGFAHQNDNIFKTAVQGLIHCAAKGQIEAVEALSELKTYFVQLKNEQEAQ